MSLINIGGSICLIQFSTNSDSAGGQIAILFTTTTARSDNCYIHYYRLFITGMREKDFPQLRVHP